MVQIVRDRERIARWNLGVEHGLVVILDRLDEIDGLFSLCRFVQTPQSPLKGIFDALNDRDIDLDRWADHLRDMEDLDRGGDRRGYDPWRTEGFGERRTPLATLIDALSLARILWTESSKEGPNLNLLLILTDPKAAANKVACEVVGDAVGIAFQYGSLTEALFKLPLKVTAFGVCLVLGEGITPSARTTDFVDRLRGAANQAGPNILPRIDEIQPQQVGARGMIVLVPGLLGTDVGTFGELENELTTVQWNRRGKSSSEQFLVVGYPHDSVMKSVEVNAEDLLKQLERLGGPRTVFVCHSRGGLVARAAAVLNPGRKVQSELLAAVTFGTPHLGASLAESPGELSLAVMLLQGRKQTGKVDTLADLLCCYATDDKLLGVQDLKPARSGVEYIRKLETGEQGLKSGETLNMLRFGGIAEPTGVVKWLVRRLLGNQKHDLVVETSSTLPAGKRGNEGPLANVDHFGYFDRKLTAVRDAESFVMRHL